MLKKMWKLNRIFYTGKDFIKNSDLPVCLNCVYFIRPTRQNDDYELYGKCKKFGEMNVITGEIEYSRASRCRLDEEKCGLEGTGYNKGGK